MLTVQLPEMDLIDDREGADDNAPRAHAEDTFDFRLGPDAATDLHGYVNSLDDVANEVTILVVAVCSGIEVNDVETVRSFGYPALRPVDGIVIEGNRIVHVAVRKPHGSSIKNVDPCVQLHTNKISEGADIVRKTDHEMSLTVDRAHPWPVVVASCLLSPCMPAVTATDVEFRYGSNVAIATSSFEIPRGVVTTLIGPNGSGKSTLLNAIAGLATPTSGVLTVEGAASQAMIALVLQTTKVNEALPITVREVVSMGRYPSIGEFSRLSSGDRRRVDDSMERMSIGDLAGKHLSELSGGQRQRVFIAQGLAQDRDLLLLDEPLTGLDLPSAQAIDAVIHDEQVRGGTVIMSTHDLAEASVAGHVVLLANRVIASGTPESVLTAKNLKAAYGAALLHVEGEQIFLDDPAHRPTDNRHVHQDRSIHLEAFHDDGAE